MFLLIFNQLIKMLLIMLVAFFCYRIGMVSQEGNRSISALLLNVINPLLIISTYQTDYDPSLIRGLLIAFVLAAAAHGILILTANLFIRGKDNPELEVERFAVVYSNCGFMGIPLINSVMGSEGVFYLTAYMVMFNIFSWTHGLALLQGSFSLKSLKKGLLSPMVIATMLALFLFFFQIRIPSPFSDSMNYIVNMNTPLAMMAAGFSVAQSDLKKIFANLQIYKVCLAKLLLGPLIVLAVLALLHVDSQIAYVTLIAAACPTGTTVTMMSIQFKKNYRYASEIFSVSTILSMATLPLLVWLAGILFA